MNVACFTVLKNVLYPLALMMVFFSCSRNRRIVEMFTADTCSAHQSSVLWFPSRPYKYCKNCSPGPGSLTVGIEPANTKWGIEIGLMYFLWNLGKRFRARSQDSAVYFHRAGSRCSSEFLAPWMHSCPARDKELGCDCQQTCLRKPLMSTSQTCAGFEVKAVNYLDCILVSSRALEGHCVTQVTWCTVGKLLILTFPAWPCPGAGWSDTGAVHTRLSLPATSWIHVLHLHFSHTHTSLTSRPQRTVSQTKQGRAGSAQGFKK